MKVNVRMMLIKVIYSVLQSVTVSDAGADNEPIHIINIAIQTTVSTDDETLSSQFAAFCKEKVCKPFYT